MWCVLWRDTFFVWCSQRGLIKAPHLSQIHGVEQKATIAPTFPVFFWCSSSAFTTVLELCDTSWHDDFFQVQSHGSCSQTNSREIGAMAVASSLHKSFGKCNIEVMRSRANDDPGFAPMSHLRARNQFLCCNTKHDQTKV